MDGGTKKGLKPSLSSKRQTKIYYYYYYDSTSTQRYWYAHRHSAKGLRDTYKYIYTRAAYKPIHTTTYHYRDCERNS